MPTTRSGVMRGATRGGTRCHGDVNALDQIAEIRLETIARLRQVDLDLVDNVPRTSREHENAVAHQHRFLDIVRHQNHALDRQLAFGPEIKKVRAQCFGGQHVERGKRFVHQQNIGVHDESACEADTLAHAARQFARIGGFVPIKADQIDAGERPLANLRLRQAKRFKAQLHVFKNCQPRKQRECLEHHRDAGRRAGHRLAAIDDIARRRPRQTGDQPQQRRLSRAGAAQQSDDFALYKRQIDVIENKQLLAIRLGKGLAARIDLQQCFAHGLCSVIPAGISARHTNRAAARTRD